MLFEALTAGTIPPRTDRHVLGGVIKINGVLASKRVVVIDRYNLNYIASTWSGQESGAWSIRGISEYDERRLLVIAFDDTGEYNAEIADFVSQVAAS